MFESVDLDSDGKVLDADALGFSSIFVRHSSPLVPFAPSFVRLVVHVHALCLQVSGPELQVHFREVAIALQGMCPLPPADKLFVPGFPKAAGADGVLNAIGALR